MRVLVVDDSPTSRTLIRMELERGGYEVEEASGGEEAISLVASNPPHLITMDVEMPTLDGYETCARLRQLPTAGIHSGAGGSGAREGSLPIVFITADDTLEGRIEGFNAGATDFLRKPFAKGALLKTVDGLLKPESQYADQSVLVVEDSDLVRGIIRDGLQRLGLRITEAANGKEALDFLRGAGQEFDLVITDYNMPVMDGIEFCRRVRADLGLHQLPVIFLSAAAESESILRMFEAGGDDYLVKPFTKEVLLARVNAHLRTRRLTRELNRQVGELRRLHQLKNDFVAITSQDLRSPLTAILGYADLMTANSCTEEEIREFLGQIRNSAASLLNMVNDIITLSRLQSVDSELKLQPIPIYEELHQILEPFQEAVQANGIELTVENRFPQSPIIMGNQEGLLGIINNLMSNAVKHTPSGGNIAISIQPQGRDAAAIWFTDTGPGMSRDHLATLFDWVDPSPRKSRGEPNWRGLGLLITKDLVEKQQGIIEAYSEKGKGMQFKIVFPLDIQQGA